MKSFATLYIFALTLTITGCAGGPQETSDNCQWVTSSTSSGVLDKPNQGYNTCNSYRTAYKPGYDNYMRQR